MLPLRLEARPTQPWKSSAMYFSQWASRREGDHLPPASVSAVCPPADMPYMPTFAVSTTPLKRGSCATASIARVTSSGRRFQLSGPMRLWSL